jgi:BlaI family transcriptional regulator, penicillinase repressor
MPRRASSLAPQELEIMKIVWERGEATVRDVYEALRARRPIAYTTVLTMMKVLDRKGYLATDRGERAHVYRPQRPQQRVVADMLRDFVDRVFNGSAEPVVQHLIRDGRLSEPELRSILRRLREKE